MKVQPTTSTSITFRFTAENNTTNAGFLCSLDDIIIDDCSEGFITYPDLEIGEEHTFQVSAYIPDGGEGEVDTTPVTWVWTVVPEPPPPLDTIITSATDGNGDPVGNESSTTTSTSITFRFTAENNTTNAGFLCSLDDIIIDDCSEGFITYPDLEIGEEHTFQVSAYIPDGGEGEVDTTPATWVWTVVPEPPPPLDTIITSATDGNGDPVGNESSTTTSTSITFRFTAENNTTNAGFLCSLDDIIIDDCSEGFITYPDLEIGEEHTFQVSAYIPDGGEGEIDTTPATWVWTIVPIVVETTIDSAIDGNEDPVANLSSTTSNDIEFNFLVHVMLRRFIESWL